MTIYNQLKLQLFLFLIFTHGLQGQITDINHANSEMTYSNSLDVQNHIKKDAKGNLKVLDPTTCEWIYFGGPSNGVDGSILALEVDSIGNLYVGGQFTIAGDIITDNIAMWDGSKWDSLGGGINGQVHCMAFDNQGHLVVGGSFSSAGGISTPRVARWDGSSWSGFSGVPNGTIISLDFNSQNEMFIGGLFSSISGMPANRVAKWDGTAWSSLGTGVNGAVETVRVANGDTVYVGGGFTTAGGQIVNRIAMWDGASWSQLGTGMNNFVFSIEIDSNGTVYAGGGFTNAGGNVIRGIAQWDGTSWSDVGGLNASGVRKIRIHENGDLYISGGRTISIWDGSTWTTSVTLSMGILDFYPIDTSNIYLGGNYNGNSDINNVTLWDGSSFQVFGSYPNMAPNEEVLSIYVVDKNEVFVGGVFNIIGDLDIEGIAIWDGSKWDSLGGGINGNVYDIEMDNEGNIYAAGAFSFAGGLPAANIAKWDGALWSPLGNGLNNLVTEIDIHSNGEIYAAGAFTQSGSQPVNRIAKWNGSTWSALGDGTNNAISDITFDQNDNLYAVGFFTTAGGNAANRIAKWDGFSWSNLGTGMNNVVNSVYIDQNEDVIAGGFFTQAGDSTASRIARWDGSAWHPMGTMFTVEHISEDLFGTLYASDHNGVASYNGTSWDYLAVGPEGGLVRSFWIDSSLSIYFGGRFTRIQDSLSWHFAILDCPELLTCPDISVYLDNDGMVAIDTSDLDCDFPGADEVYITRTSFDCSAINDSNVLDSLVVVNVNDTSYYIFNVTVLDTIPPTATCEDITTYLDSFGLVTVSPLDITFTTDDNCEANLIRVFEDDYDCTNLGNNQATFETIDPSGNTGQCPLTITVVDSFPPFSNCANLTIYLDDIGLYVLSTDDIDSMTYLTVDNCAIDSIGLSQSSFSCEDMPSTQVTLTFKDQSGNISNCEVTITVLDTISPTLNCQNITLDLLESATVELTPNQISFTTDNCTLDTQFVDNFLFTCSEISTGGNGLTSDTMGSVNSFNVISNGFPGGVDADTSKIYISDRGTNEVFVYDYDGNLLQSFNAGDQSYDITIDSLGKIYVLNRTTNAIEVYDTLGTHLYDITNQVNGPWGIDVFKGKLYLNNTSANNIVRYDLNGNFEAIIIPSFSQQTNGLRVTEDRIFVALTDSCAVHDLLGNELFTFALSDFPNGGVFDQNYNLYIPRWNIQQLSVHDDLTGQLRYAIDDQIISACIVGDKLIGLGFDVFIYDLLFAETGSTELVMLTAQDESGNTATCTVDVTITDTHGYCCPDTLSVNYNPIDSTNYYASDSICSSGLVESATTVNFNSLVVKIDTSFQVENGGIFQVINEDCNQ